MKHHDPTILDYYFELRKTILKYHSTVNLHNINLLNEQSRDLIEYVESLCLNYVVLAIEHI